MITNKPEKIVSHQLIPTGFSDHFVLNFLRKSGKPVNHQKYFLKRKFKEIDWHQLNSDINQDHRLRAAIMSDNTEFIAGCIINSISENMDKQQPVTKVQVKVKTPGFASETTKELKKSKEEALKTVKRTKNNDDLRKFRNLCNRCHKELSKDKHNKMKANFEDTKDDPKMQWNVAKQSLGWVKSLSPHVIVNNGKVLTSPKLIVNELNKGFIDKKNTKKH